jgi:hypothetical protein
MRAANWYGLPVVRGGDDMQCRRPVQPGSEMALPGCDTTRRGGKR